MKKFLACMLMVLMLAALIGCGSKGSGSGSSAVTGTWNLKSANVSGIEVTAEQMGRSMSFTFNEDGSATMTADGSTTSGLSWTYSNSVLTLTYGDTKLYDFNYEGSRLVLTEPNSGVELIFVR